MYKGFLHTHYLVVTLFLIIYVIKTVLLLSNKKDLLSSFNKKIRIPEMIISTLFLVSGIFLMTKLPFGGKYDYLFWIKLAMVFTSIPVAIIGFKKQNKVLAALSLLLITGSYGLAEVYAKRKGIAKEMTVAIAGDAKTLYEANCKLCHGSDGKLGISGASDLSATSLDTDGIKNVIIRGKNMMQPIPVSEDQAAAIAEYVNGNLKSTQH
jgi:uncharacterized membrane protein SirB2